MLTAVSTMAMTPGQLADRHTVYSISAAMSASGWRARNRRIAHTVRASWTVAMSQPGVW
jgi:hypothetical protein